MADSGSMMPKKDLPADSKSYADLAFREKKKWHRRRARMSLARKLEILDRLRELYTERPMLVDTCPHRSRGTGPRD